MLELTHIYVIIGILLLHWFSDFVLQTRIMAEGKSSSIKWLTLHVVVYSIPFIIFGWVFALITFVTHWLTDFITSKISAKFYKNGNMKGFWAAVGFDQFIHSTTLILTYIWMIHEYSFSWFF